MSNKNIIKGLLISTLSLSVFYCSDINTGNQSKGYVKLSLKFPERQAFSIKAIPSRTESIEINIKGEGIPENRPIVQKISRSQSDSSVMIRAIPTGSKTVEVKAYDSDNIILASEKGNVTIEENRLSSITLELKEIFQDLTLKINQLPEGAVKSVAEISIAGKNINQEFKGNELKLEKLSPGLAIINIKSSKDDGTIIAQASKEVRLSGVSQSISIDLLNITKPLPSPSPSPKPSVIPEQLKELVLKINNFPALAKSGAIQISTADGKKIYKEFSGNEIKFSVLKAGTVSIKITIYDNENHPLANIEKEIDFSKNSTQSVSLERVEIPESFEINDNNQIAQTFLERLNKLMISSESNNKPTRDSIEVKINGQIRQPGIFEFLCVKPGDSINIKVSASDKDGDPLSYYWGKTDLSETSARKMQVLPEKTDSISRTVDKLGSWGYGFVITDKKSYYGPETILFVSRDKCILN